MLRSRSGRWMATIASTSQILVLASSGEPQATVSAPPFEAVFELEEVIELGEDPADSIAEIGVFVERRDGGFIIGDRLLPRVRTYAEDGGLEAGFGRFGDGPWEFRRIDGVAEMSSGRIVVVNWRNPGLTYLTSELARDTIVPVNGYVVFDALSFGSDLVLEAVGEGFLAEGRADENGHYHRYVDGGMVWSNWQSPLFDKPYWGGLTGGTRGVTTAGDSLFIIPRCCIRQPSLMRQATRSGRSGLLRLRFVRFPRSSRAHIPHSHPRGRTSETWWAHSTWSRELMSLRATTWCSLWAPSTKQCPIRHSGCSTPDWRSTTATRV
ncbi:MAG: hypothetical protein OXH66_03310 [Gemmatimonadetes bacterium]|nr:hypothetical protein [Gemmatimonadota bacterium]